MNFAGQGNRGGRGNGRRNNLDPYRKPSDPPSSKRKPYLNFPIGRPPRPEQVAEFMQDLKTELAVQCPESDIHKIINDNGTLNNDYTLRDEPEIPDEDGLDDSQIYYLRLRYANATKLYDKWTEDFRKGKIKGTAIALNALGQDSKARLRETEAGRNSIENDDILQLLIAIYASHNTDHLQDDENALVIAQRRFYGIHQANNETIQQFYTRFKAHTQSLSY